MWQSEMVDELKAASNGDRRRILHRYAERTGYSVPYLYTLAREHGWTSGRRQREDTGEAALNAEQLQYLSALMHATRRQDKGVIMPVEKALEIAYDNGIIDRGSVSLGHVQRLLRERQMCAEALDAETPHTNMRSLHPNHVHLVDASQCIQYYLKNGRTKILSERDFYKNRPSDYSKVKTSLKRYVLVDHFSGSFFLYYYDAAGESQNNLYDFLIRSWERKQHEQYPFRGVPAQMLWDKGSANTSRAVGAFLGRLGVGTPDGMPGNARRQGGVEVAQNIVETWFESALAIEPARTVEDLNRWAFDFCVWFNATREHTRTRMTRAACWASLIRPEQLRDLPEREILQALYSFDAEQNTRLVSGDWTISFTLKGDVNRYNLRHIPGLLPTRSRVLVRVRPWDWPVVDVVYNEQVYEAKPLEILPAVLGGFRADAAIIGQEYRGVPESAAQAAMKRADNLAYGDRAGEGRDDRPFSGTVVHGIHADKVGNLAFLPKRGSAIEIDRESVDRQISFAELIKRFVAAGAEMTPELNRRLRAAHGDAIPEREAERIIAGHRDGAVPEKGEEREVV